MGGRNYEETLQFLGGLPYREVKPGLERVRFLLDSLGNPERDYRSIHVGGSNGKGSVVALLSSVLSPSLSVGRFVSPPLLNFRDRISVGERRMGKGELVRGVEALSGAVEELSQEGDPPSLFEVATALASFHFREEGVELALLETGLGGRFDATRECGNPLLSVVTNVQLEHRDILGPGLEDIAWELAGLTAEGSPLILGESPPDDLLEIFREECREKGASLKLAGEKTELKLLDFDWERWRYRVGGSPLSLLKEGEELKLGLLGRFQEKNLRTALAVLAELEGKVFSIEADQLKSRLRGASWPGRLQLVSRNPFLILDGAHNEPAARVLAAEIERYRLLLEPSSRVILIFSALRDKDVTKMARELSRVSDEVILTGLDHYRAAGVAELADAFEDAGIEPSLIETFEEPSASFPAGKERAKEADLICVCGSLYLVREAIEFGFGG